MEAVTIPEFNTTGLRFGLEYSTLIAWIIVALLVLLSITSWAVMMSKLRLLVRSTKASREFLKEFRDSFHPLALFQTRERFDLSPIYHVYHAACRELSFYLVGEDEPGQSFASRLQGAGRITSSQMSAVQNAMERAVAEASLRLEGRLGVVATVLTAAPFLGLLGTVWGVMDSFGALVETGEDAGIQALAPGVSAALVTTVVGLLVAIPSMVGYNYLVNRIREMIVRLDNFASELSGLLDRQFVDHRQGPEELPSLGAIGSASMPSISRAPAQSPPVSSVAS
jgi:biopolymer transport protein TolQ